MANTRRPEAFTLGPSIGPGMADVQPSEATPRGQVGSRARKRPRGAPAHIVSLPLRLTPREVVLSNARFHAGLRMYNACLQAAFERAAAVRADPQFAQAQAMPRASTADRAARTAAFHALDVAHEFTESALMSYASSLRQHWMREQVGAQEAQALGRRAYRAVRDWHLGIHGRPRFKAARRGLHSLECKDGYGDMQPILHDGTLVGFQWGGHRFTLAQPKTAAEREEFARIEGVMRGGHYRYSRVIRTRIRGRWTYRVQFVVEGLPPVRPKARHDGQIGQETVSYDLGPSWIHGVTDTRVFHWKLAPGVADLRKELRRLARHFDRQHRAGSPACFRADGSHISGRCHWRQRSNAAFRTQQQIAEQHRRVAAPRKSEHGRMANDLLAFGVFHKAETLSYVAWQKTFPHSVRDRAPGLFVTIDRRKAASAGGDLYEYAPRTTALSSTCLCGARAKKPLHQRRHRHICPNGPTIDADRDLFSAFLGLYVSPQGGKDTLDLVGAQRAFAPRRKDLSRSPEVEAPTRSVGTTKARVHVRRPGRRSVVRMLQRQGRYAPAKGSDGELRRKSQNLQPRPSLARPPVERSSGCSSSPPTADRFSERLETAESRNALGVDT